MNRLTVYVAVLFVSLTAAGQLHADAIVVAGQARTYLLHAPSGLANPPLVINMHGLTGTGSQQQMYSRMDRVADRENFVVVYPDDIDNTWDVSGD
jgi:polyhydroxybutyrate depolymerase